MYFLCVPVIFSSVYIFYSIHSTRACKAYRQCSHLVSYTLSIDRVPNIILIYVYCNGEGGEVRKIKM